MKLKKFYKIESILAMIFGVFLMVTSQIPIAGAAIGITNITQNSSMLWGSFFILTGGVLFYTLSRE